MRILTAPSPHINAEDTRHTKKESDLAICHGLLKLLKYRARHDVKMAIALRKVLPLLVITIDDDPDRTTTAGVNAVTAEE